MICQAQIQCPVIKFSQTNELSVFSADGKPFTIFISNLYNQEEYQSQIITNLPFEKISFYEYRVFPTVLGVFDISVTVESINEVFSCTSPSLTVDILVKKLRTSDDNIFTMDSDIITTDSFIP